MRYKCPATFSICGGQEWGQYRQTGLDMNEMPWAKFSSIADKQTGRSMVVINDKNFREMAQCHFALNMKHDDFLKLPKACELCV